MDKARSPRTVAARVATGSLPPTRRRPADGCLVAVAPLAAVLRRFMTDWARDHPGNGGQFSPAATVSVQMVTATEYLVAASARQAQLAPPGQGRVLTTATLRNVLEQRIAFTEFRTADAIVTAMRRPELFHDGTLEIVPNPAASRAARAECCGACPA